ncbi:MAG: prephenate dehydratase [Chloroflexi bacterium]|nr:prephenate dehydratase [Chloroflexota bacterium]
MTTRRLAFLGPAGTYSEQAALNYDASATLMPYPSIPAVVAAVDRGEAEECIVPIENSIEGAVTFTLDSLIHESSLSIKRELLLPIVNCLWIAPGASIEGVRVIYSHPQPFAQCRVYLEKHFPTTARVASLSTAGSVQDMLNSKQPAAAIAPERAGKLYGVELVARGIDDNPNNITRFVVLASADHAPTGQDKTSICFDFDHDAPGILYNVLGEFAKRGINMAKIESRPTRQNLGRYIFLVDIEGHREDRVVKEALEAVKTQVSMFKILGSYPRQVSSSRM